jgi:WD40 repeat protein
MDRFVSFGVAANTGRDAPLAWSRDGKTLATVHASSQVQLWDSALTPRRLVDHDGWVMCITANPKRELFAAGDRYGRIRLFSNEGEGSLVLQHRGTITSLAWRPDGEVLAAAAFGMLRFWTADGERLHEFPCLGDLIAWSSDGERIVTGDEDGTIRLFDLNTGEVAWSAIRLGPDESVTFSAAGEVLQGDPSVIEEELVYLVESEPGKLEVLKPSEFDQRIEGTGEVKLRP